MPVRRPTVRTRTRSTAACVRSACARIRRRRSARQIAQAEIDAQFRNDPDAALSASKRLGASFVLRGLITSQTNRNPMIRVNQVSVAMGFTLTGSNGQLISTADASAASYSGADVGQDGADAGQRAGRRSCRQAVCAIIARRRASPRPRNPEGHRRLRRRSSVGAIERASKNESRTQSTRESAMTNRTCSLSAGLLLGAVAAACTSLAIAQPRFGRSLADRGKHDVAEGEPDRRSRRLYQAVTYTNTNKKGPALVVIPGEIKSSNATFLQKFTANNIADFGEIELSSANFQVLERTQPRPVAARVRARLQPRRSRTPRASTCAWASSRRRSTSSSSTS